MPLALTLEKRTPLAPGIPAVAETLPGYNVVPWLGLVAPAGTPAEIITDLHDATRRALAKPEVAAALANMGIEVAPMNPAEFSSFIESEILRWANLVKIAGIEPQ